ncbi:MAG TPA: hypothetical protein VGL81_30585 [Polyangiaceae bacterium]|jgi:hypothetical protein
MKTTIRFGARTIVLVSLLALPAGSVACGAAPGSPEDGVDPAASSADPVEKPALAAPDFDAAPPADTEEPTGALPDAPSPGPGPHAPKHGILQQ